jgi:hypothetical protein
MAAQAATGILPRKKPASNKVLLNKGNQEKRKLPNKFRK